MEGVRLPAQVGCARGVGGLRTGFTARQCSQGRVVAPGDSAVQV